MLVVSHRLDIIQLLSNVQLVLVLDMPATGIISRAI